MAGSAETPGHTPSPCALLLSSPRFPSHSGPHTQLSESGGSGSGPKHPKGQGRNQAKGLPEMAQAESASEDTKPNSI